MGMKATDQNKLVPSRVKTHPPTKFEELATPSLRENRWTDRQTDTQIDIAYYGNRL